MVSFVVSKKKIKGTIDYFEYDSDGFKYYPKFKSFISDNGVDIRYKYLIDVILFEFDKDFDKTFLKRCRAYDNNGKEFDINMVFNMLKKSKYISDGNPDTIVIKEENKNRLGTTDKKVITY